MNDEDIIELIEAQQTEIIALRAMLDQLDQNMGNIMESLLREFNGVKSGVKEMTDELFKIKYPYRPRK